MYKLYAAFTGALITIMMSLNGILSTYTGNYFSSVIIHIVGLIPLLFILILKNNKIKLIQKIPWYFYLGGAVGVFTVIAGNISINKLGVSLVVSLSLLGQTVSSAIIDNCGLLSMKKIKFKKQKLLGLILISLGIIVMIFGCVN